MTTYTAHTDTFSRDNLPPPEWQAEQLFLLPELQFPEKLNCSERLLDRHIAEGNGKRIAIRTAIVEWSYQTLFEKSNQIARVLREDLQLQPGNRVLLRSSNNPMMAACWFGIIKAGGIVVATMPLLRANDLVPIIKKAEIHLALCDERLIGELTQAAEEASVLKSIKQFSGAGEEGSESELESLMDSKSTDFQNTDTASDDTALIAFTSGTTGEPKGTMHYHRDVISMCVCVADNLIKPDADDVFIGSPPLAFTFGLGMQLAFPLYAGACTVLLEAAPPPQLLEAICKFRATVCSTAPIAYRAMLNLIDDHDLSCLKKPVSAGEHLPPPTALQWREKTGNTIIDGLGATELIHIFISARAEETREGATGKAVPGYQCCILGENDQPLPPGENGRLAIKGPTACKYLADERQKKYVVNGWNLTGDICRMDEDGYVYYVSRADDMIISAGYNISGPEVEVAILEHDAVAECAVVGASDRARGTIVKAFIVLHDRTTECEELIVDIQEHVKRTIAPYKYPREIEFIATLPKTQTGKIQRHVLRS